MKLILLYFVVLNAIGLFLMGEDKRRAKKRLWRVSEKALFGCSLLGGSIGTWAGMYLFRHKTKHWYFVAGMPFIFFCQAAAGIYIIYNKFL